MSHARDSVAPRAALRTWALATIAIAGCLIGGAAVAEAAVPERYDVRASIQRDAGIVELEEHVVVRVRENEPEIRLWLYGDRLGVAPRALGERTWRWVYPGDLDHGEIQIVYVELEDAVVEPRIERQDGGIRGRDAAGGDLVIPLEPGAARTLDVTVGLRMRVPARFGRMGRDGSTLSLAAPWYPLVVDGDAWRFVVPHRVRVESQGEVWIGGTIVSARGEVEREGAYVPVLIAPRLDLWEGEVLGVPVTWTSFEGLYRSPPASDRSTAGVSDPLQVDRLGLMQRELRPVIETARWLGLSVPARIDLLMVPSRTELVGTAPGVVLVSDRWAQIFPIDAVQQFHLRAMRRALFGRIAQPIADRLDAPADRGVTEEVRAAVLLEVDAVRRTAHGQTPEQLLSAFAFHPAVDQLLYAPQIAFEEVYFEGADAGDAWRDDPGRARLPLPRGRRVLESARDVIAEERFGTFVASVARGRRSVRSALERAGAGDRWDGWMDAPQLEVNYRLGTITSERIGDRWRHTVEVIREGAHRVEPVEVEVESDRGEHVRGVWDGPGARGEVVIETEGARRSVTIDPRHRIPQSPAVADGHPRADDATDQPWRPPIFTGFAFDILASESDVTGLIDVVLRQRYDLEHTFALRLLRTASSTGGRVRYIQGLGPKVHNNRRAMTLGGGVGFYYVEPGFGGADQPGGFATDVDLLLSLDTRAYLYDWREGVSLAVQAQVRTTVREDGSVGASGRATARGSGTIAIGNLHAIVIVGHAGVTINPVLAADYQSAGGRYGLRGFANDELLGTSALYAVAEHRFTAVTDLSWNVFHGVWARELQLAWWIGGGAVLGAADGRDAVGAAEVGVGLRVHYEYAGVQPGVLALDLGAPVSRWAESTPCAFGGQAGACDGRTPFGFYVSVDQYY